MYTSRRNLCIGNGLRVVSEAGTKDQAVRNAAKAWFNLPASPVAVAESAGVDPLDDHESVTQRV